jgi:hypothetical protein
MHKRSSEHSDAVRRMDMSYAIAKHMRNHHDDDDVIPEFMMKLISSHNNNLERMIMEGILIERQVRQLSMNLKTGWNCGRGIVRLTAGRM